MTSSDWLFAPEQLALIANITAIRCWHIICFTGFIGSVALEGIVRQKTEVSQWLIFGRILRKDA
jgi:hypothetical protein